MIEFIEALESAMRENGFSIQGTINYQASIPQRFKDAHKPHKGANIFLIIHSDKLGATFGDWHDKEGQVKWRFKQTQRLSLEEKVARQLEIEQSIKRRQDKLAWSIGRANRFRYTFHVELNFATNHPYIRRKQIQPYYGELVIWRWRRSLLPNDYLIIPFHDIEYNFKGLQIIKANGFKRFWKGTSPKDNMIWLIPLDEMPLSNDYTGVIRICEGYATGCTIHEITKSPVICAMSAHNLPSVAAQVARHYPHAIVKICADNDQWGENNVGLGYALSAAKITGFPIYYPTFDSLDVRNKPTDFNDLFVLGGHEKTKYQLIFLRT